MVTWLPPALAMVLFALASIVTGIYFGNTQAISYPTPISAELLWAHRSTLTVASLQQAWAGPYHAAFVASVIAWPVLMSRHSRRLALIAAAIPLVVLLPLNLFGAYVAAVELLLRPGWDGETLAEGWPLVELYGIWSLWCLVFLVHMWRGGKSATQRTPVLGGST